MRLPDYLTDEIEYREQLRRARDQIRARAGLPLIAPALEREVGRARLVPAVRRTLLAIVFLVGAAIGASIPAGCGGAHAPRSTIPGPQPLPPQHPVGAP